MTATFYNGQEVLTRRGKRGVVTAVNEGAWTVTVRFGSREYEMRFGQVVDARLADKAARRVGPTNR